MIKTCNLNVNKVPECIKSIKIELVYQKQVLGEDPPDPPYWGMSPQCPQIL